MSASPSLPSISDVARVAQVSTATVSRVLNGASGVSPETVERVRSVVDELNYQPIRVRSTRNTAGGTARAANRTNNIAVVTMGQGRGWLDTPVMATALNSMCTAAAVAGCRVILGEVLHPRAPQPLLDPREIDGAIAFISLNDPEAVHAIARKVPLVWAMGGETGVAIDHVAPDHFRIGYLGYSYLRQRGCQEVAFVTPNPDWELMRQRGQSFLNASYDARRPARAFVVSDNPTVSDPYGKTVTAAPTPEALAALIAAARPRIDGLFFGNDRSLSLFYPLLRNHGLMPGENLTVIGCDNEEARLSSLHPRPASIEVGAEQIGQRAVTRLLARIARPDEPPILICVTPRVVPPPSSNAAG